MNARAFAVALIVLGACQPPPPQSPTWFADVQPLVVANCARCHGADPETPALSWLRLDRYVKFDSSSFDAYDYRDAIVSSAALRNVPVMPPDYALSDRQRRLLERWVELGAPKGQRDNRLPEVERVAPVESSIAVDQTLALSIRSWDADGDGLVVRIGAREVGSQLSETVITTGGGLRAVTLDTSSLTSGRTYEVFAVLDDGYADDPAANAKVVVVVPSVLVDHGARGSPPTVRLEQPSNGGALSGTVPVAWSASDPDPNDMLTIDLQLLEIATDGSATVVSTIASGLANSSSPFAWNTDGVAASRGGLPIQYKVRVVASDGHPENVRFDDSDAPFTIAQTTVYTWADVQPVFLNTCRSCHGAQPQPGVPATFRLDKYDAADPVLPIDTKDGVYEKRDRVYARMTAAANKMPPVYATPKPTTAEIAMVADWINGGAPRGP